jgi:hypothetical protein
MGDGKTKYSELSGKMIADIPELNIPLISSRMCLLLCNELTLSFSCYELVNSVIFALIYAE